MSEQAELNLTPPTSSVRNTVGKRKEQTSKNSGCSGKNSKIQEVSQHSKSRTLDARDLRRKLGSRHSRSISGSPERNPSVLSRIRRDRSKSPRHRSEGRRDGGVFNRLRGVAMRGHHHEIRKHSSKAKIAGVDTGSQGRRRQSQALKKMNYPNHGYDDLKKSFLASYLQQKKCIKDPVEIHHIKQREGEFTEDFVQRFKAESRHVKGSPKCMRISGFMHGITNPELIKRLHNNIPKLVDEIMRITAAFLRVEVAASNQVRKKTLMAWKQQEVGRKQILTEWEISGISRDQSRDLKQGSGKDQPKIAKKGETSGKDKPQAILMVQPWKKVSRQKITQSFSPNPKISFPPLGDEDGEEGPMIIQSKIRGHFIHRRNHMANETNIDASENKGCVEFHRYMDEICGSKSTVSGQWDHMKARSEEDSSSHINSSWNAKILDAYKGYHQIKMAKEDEEKTTFITSQGVFCYSKMPFGLKNVGATYQHLVDKAFQKQIGRNLEVYVDDLVIKSHTKHEIIRDIDETFKTLKEINLNLNPKKCTFEIEEGMFLGYKVNTKGIMVCRDKVRAILSLPFPKCLKDVQKLNGKLASLNIFLSKSVEKSLPFFKTLKKCTKKSDFQWTAEAKAAFKEIKTNRRAPNINCTNGERRIDCVPRSWTRGRSHDHCHYGPTNQADTVKTRGRRKAAEMEY
nr:reverse transcriptase domain-containing protein [Tanacetum cinerariifolium]